MNFCYDAAGTPMAVQYNGTYYYYVTNLQGDVIALTNDAGAAVVSYTYDAWGKILSTGGSMASTLGVYDPLRYRGYVYDRETGLYYLQSRYYDPEIGRWIDPSGNWPQMIKDGIKWIANESVDPVVITVQKTMSNVYLTRTSGPAFGGTIGIIGVTVTPCVSVDTKGNIALQASGSWGITTSPGGALTVGKTSLFTNAPNVDKLLGDAGVIGGSVFLPVVEALSAGTGVDLNIIPDSQLGKTYYGVSILQAISTSLGSEFHAGPGYTIPIFSVNVFDIYDKLYEGVIEW